MWTNIGQILIEGCGRRANGIPKIIWGVFAECLPRLGRQFRPKFGQRWPKQAKMFPELVKYLAEC